MKIETSSLLLCAAILMLFQGTPHLPKKLEVSIFILYKIMANNFFWPDSIIFGPRGGPNLIQDMINIFPLWDTNVDLSLRKGVNIFLNQNCGQWPTLLPNFLTSEMARNMFFTNYIQNLFWGI